MTTTTITYHYPTTPPPSIYIGWVLKAHYVYVVRMQEEWYGNTHFGNRWKRNEEEEGCG